MFIMNSSFDLKISIVVPALNEEDNLRDTVEAIIRCFSAIVSEFEILIYDDNSSDRTPEVADELARSYKNVRAFHNSSCRNIGGIYKQGLQAAKYDYFMLITGDNEVIIERLLPAFAYLKETDAIIFYHANEYARPLFRQFLSHTYTAIINLIFFTRFKYTNDTNIYKKSLLTGIRIVADDFSYQTEVIIKLAKKGMKFVEFGKDIRQRIHGKSKSTTLKSFCSVCKSIFCLWLEVMVVNRKKYRAPQLRN